MASHGHDGHHTPHAHGSDKGPAFIGLLGGMVLLVAVMYGIVQWTNTRFEGHAAGGAAPAAQTKH